MKRQAFTFHDLAQECQVETGHHRVDNRSLGARIRVPERLYRQYPYNASAYAFLQQLRPAIHEFGLLEFPDLPVNKTNHTLAQRAPGEHAYSSNSYLTDICQSPHQDTPPMPTAFWLGARRQFFATWIVSAQGLEAFADLSGREPGLGIVDLHRQLVPRTLADQSGLLVNSHPGLVLLDNSNAQSLYHARTCRFQAVADEDFRDVSDSPMYAFNEVGLLHYIDSLDSRRGNHDRNMQDRAEVEAFLEEEQSPVIP